VDNVDYSKLRSLTARKIINALKRDGFDIENYSSGAHQQYYNPDGRRVTLTFHHSSDTFPPKTLKTIIEKQAKWTLNDLRRLKLI